MKTEDAQPGDQHSDLTRLSTLDIFRGLVMMIMALDHVRDFTNRSAMEGLPTDLEITTPALFFTRWITHICAPAFALTAGVAAWLWWQRGRSRLELSRFLLTRGVWLIALELTVMQLAYYFSWPPNGPVLLLVLWSLGLSMIILAGLIWLPAALIGSLCAAAILFHPLLSPIQASDFGPAAGFWNAIYQVGAFKLGDVVFVTPYPLIPWAGIMAFGFLLGPVFAAPASRRAAVLFGLGLAGLGAFVALRLWNGFGDPVPWTERSDAFWTVIAFLNVSKYPASPAFLLMTLGITFLSLSALERCGSLSTYGRIAEAFGRVPLFFYLLHFYLAHLFATALALANYGLAAVQFIFLPYPSFGGQSDAFPAGFGYPLWTTYGVWLAVLISTYPLCRWFSGIKAKRIWWTSYL